ncbi:pyrrolidone-carboxylate peptidase [Striga asiatica]|uniref:Pyrrolidone-carboxylate peptidase n=1 Tax=Striga asiatica TaxID=4170 RepID=A0A5A7QVP3_STRAF|nr:pyrrolidone-carboxylate peptidase [Striga asiatica]
MHKRISDETVTVKPVPNRIARHPVTESGNITREIIPTDIEQSHTRNRDAINNLPTKSVVAQIKKTQLRAVVKAIRDSSRVIILGQIQYLQAVTRDQTIEKFSFQSRPWAPHHPQVREARDS